MDHRSIKVANAILKFYDFYIFFFTFYYFYKKSEYFSKKNKLNTDYLGKKFMFLKRKRNIKEGRRNKKN